MSEPRIPFDEAIGEPLLFKKRLYGEHGEGGLSVGQRSILKTLYGCALDNEIRDPFGLTELDYWSVFQDSCELDELGYVTRVTPIRYEPKDYREGWAILGRRAGKSDAFAATIVAYEALCGGHEYYVRRGQRAICFQIAQDLRMARYSLHFIRAALEDSPIGKKAIQQITADRIDLKNGVSIYCVPPTTKSVRGFASPVAVLDEVGMWYQESDSANPDYEIYRAVTPGQIQFPNAKIIGISTPWNKAGLLYKYYEAGTGGARLHSELAREEFARAVVFHGPTAAIGNPAVSREYLAAERARDPRAFERECLAIFQDSISGFLPAALIERATCRGIVERPPQSSLAYVAAIDPAFRRDAFGFCLLHRDTDGVIVVDAIRRFEGSHDKPLNPAAVLDELAPLCRSYGVTVIYSDQYHYESLSQLARERGLEVIPTPFTAKNKAQLYGNLQQLFQVGQIQLLDHYELLKELRMLEKTLTDAGGVKIAAPAGFHDDLASVLCIAANQAMWLFPEQPKEEPKEPTVFERIQKQIESRWRGGHLSAWD